MPLKYLKYFIAGCPRGMLDMFNTFIMLRNVPAFKRSCHTTVLNLSLVVDLCPDAKKITAGMLTHTHTQNQTLASV